MGGKEKVREGEIGGVENRKGSTKTIKDQFQRSNIQLEGVPEGEQKNWGGTYQTNI